MKHLGNASRAHGAVSGRTSFTVALVMVGLIGGFYLLREHWDHAVGLWPYLLLLACPVMHLFHGHARHHAKGGKRDDPGPHGG